MRGGAHLDEAKRKPSAQRWLYVASRNTATERSGWVGAMSTASRARIAPSQKRWYFVRSGLVGFELEPSNRQTSETPPPSP